MPLLTSGAQSLFWPDHLQFCEISQSLEHVCSQAANAVVGQVAERGDKINERVVFESQNLSLRSRWQLVLYLWYLFNCSFWLPFIGIQVKGNYHGHCSEHFTTFQQNVSSIIFQKIVFIWLHLFNCRLLFNELQMCIFISIKCFHLRHDYFNINTSIWGQM